MAKKLMNAVPLDSAVPNDLLDEIEDYLESNLDVVDGSYGEPSPNKAMQLYTALKMARRKWP